MPTINFNVMQQGQCEYGHSSPATDITGMVRIKRGSETDLLAAVATVGPVAVNVDASSKLFRVSMCSPMKIAQPCGRYLKGGDNSC